mmetsp:Transcript_32313/g.86572  ORF Transcript_32313/g.86572 Transcript_32313/m.86572 type:complete len:329 (-) Transcript_32313:107-1093(-)
MTQVYSACVCAPAGQALTKRTLPQSVSSPDKDSTRRPREPMPAFRSYSHPVLRDCDSAFERELLRVSGASPSASSRFPESPHVERDAETNTHATNGDTSRKKICDVGTADAKNRKLLPPRRCHESTTLEPPQAELAGKSHFARSMRAPREAPFRRASDSERWRPNRAGEVGRSPAQRHRAESPVIVKCVEDTLRPRSRMNSTSSTVCSSGTDAEDRGVPADAAAAMPDTLFVRLSRPHITKSVSPRASPSRRCSVGDSEQESRRMSKSPTKTWFDAKPRKASEQRPDSLAQQAVPCSARRGKVFQTVDATAPTRFKRAGVRVSGKVGS